METNDLKQADIDAQNAAFWDELCGTQLANQLGISDASSASLKVFDNWYFDFYPYLEKHVPLEQMRGASILEVGLGYGSVSQRLASVTNHYEGLDIADGPVQMVNHRLQDNALSGAAQKGSILGAPFADQTFDWVIAIGCFHHTGNLQKAIDEAYRVLKPGGRAVLMVYYAYSYRRWLYSPFRTFAHLLSDKFGLGKVKSSSGRERARYDASAAAKVGAPKTDFTSMGEMQQLCKQFSSCELQLENIAQEHAFRFLKRNTANRVFGPIFGLDLYCILQK